MNRHLRSVLLIASFSGLAGAGASAQESEPKTRFFFEHTMTFRFTTRFDSNSSGTPWYGVWEGGILHRSGSTALGASVFLVGDGDGSRMGLTPRYRRWLGPNTTLDVGLGATFPPYGEDGYVVRRSPGFSGLVSVSRGNVGFRVQVEALRSAHVNIWSYDPAQQKWVADHTPFETDWGIYAGARFGGMPGVIATLVEVVFGAIAVSTIQ